MLRAEAVPIRRSLRALAAAGVERAGVVALLATVATAGAATAVAGGDESPAETITTTSTTATTTSTTVVPSPVFTVAVDQSAVNADGELTVRWALDREPDMVALSWGDPSEGMTTRLAEPGDSEAVISLAPDSPARIEIQVVAVAGGVRLEDSVTVDVNRPPGLAAATPIVIAETDDPRLVDLHVADDDDDQVAVEITAAIGDFELTDHRLLIDPGRLGPGSFGACVVATDSGMLTARTWVAVQVTPVISPGDSLWRIARRVLIAEGEADPTPAQINARMRRLGVRRWLVEPDLIHSGDSVLELESIVPVSPVGECGPDGS